MPSWMSLRHGRFGTWMDRRHWELQVGRTLVVRWCSGSPCFLTPNARHSVTVVRVRK
jgi:hypothetical protein